MIKFSNVSLIYPNSTTTVIEDLNLEIAEGELVLVIDQRVQVNLHCYALSTALFPTTLAASWLEVLK